MHNEDDLLPISALQHLLFCQRQCALIHLEQAWEENRLTAEGRILHERAHEREDESRGDIRVARGLRLRSLRLGLIGQADVVEFYREEGVAWRPYPVEYKRGKPKENTSDTVQLCAQALCLEEMLGERVPKGALFYGLPRRRMEVLFTEELRAQTCMAAERLHRLLAGGLTPSAQYEKKCDHCSLIEICLPKKVADQACRVENYLRERLA